jgi:hypothetical protein
VQLADVADNSVTEFAVPLQNDFTPDVGIFGFEHSKNKRTKRRTWLDERRSFHRVMADRDRGTNGTKG